MLEANKIYNMDCLEGMKQLDENSVDLVVTDPPYNFVACGGGFYGVKWHGKENEKREYLDKLKDLDCNTFKPVQLLKECDRVLRKFNGIFFCNKYLLLDYLHWAKNMGFLIDVHIISKANPIPAKQNHFLHDIEYIVFIKEKGAFFNSSYPVNLYKKVFKTICKRNRLHPAEKPIKLIERYIKILSNEGDLVLDAFMGSGTTALACKQLGRRFIGFEINPEYCKIAEKRLEQSTLNDTLVSSDQKEEGK